MNDGNYIKLSDLEVYQQALRISKKCWIVYNELDWNDKKIIGNQFIRSIDSIGANIAEGYGRFHYKDKVKFYYNARGSLLEAKHWAFLLCQRGRIDKQKYAVIISLLNEHHKRLNLYIRSCKKVQK